MSLPPRPVISPRTPEDAPGPGSESAGEPLEGELARFFGYSNDALVILDHKGRVVVASPSVERLLGYSIEELLGSRLLGRVHPEDRPHVRARARTLLEGHPVTGLDARVRDAQGAYLPMRWSVAVGPHGRMYAVGRDRTEEVRHHDTRIRNEMAELRLRTAMELHDGILQTLTGASLQIAVARKLVRSDPAQAEKVLEALGESVAAEQQEMRLYVDEVKGQRHAWTDQSAGAAERIGALLQRVGMIWGLATTLDARIEEEIPPEPLRRILRIIQEATVNAARHGAARNVSVRVIAEDSSLTIRTSDDGRGFSFLGLYDHETLREKRLGPLSLKHRVEDAGGRISIESTPEGATVLVQIPLEGKLAG